MGAALSHRTAADLWGLRQTAAARIDVTVPTRAGRKPRSRIRVHRAQLASAEVTMVDGIPVTTVPRTLIDFAEAVPERSVERALDEAEFLRLFDRHAIEAAIEE
jgi:predicted transcriptional regulator of viral defense system